MKPVYAFLLLLTISSCNSRSGFKFSEDIVAKERSLTADITLTEEQVSKFSNEGRFDSLAAVSERMEKLVQVKIDEIVAMDLPDAKEAEPFKNAALAYFKYIRSVYSSYKEVGKAVSDEARQVLLTELQVLVDQKEKVISDMQAAQKSYAKANGFKVE